MTYVNFLWFTGGIWGEFAAPALEQTGMQSGIETRFDGTFMRCWQCMSAGCYSDGILFLPLFCMFCLFFGDGITSFLAFLRGQAMAIPDLEFL